MKDEYFIIKTDLQHPRFQNPPQQLGDICRNPQELWNLMKLIHDAGKQEDGYARPKIEIKHETIS